MVPPRRWSRRCRNPVLRSSSWIVQFVVVPVAFFYLLRDWDVMIARIHELLPRSVEPTVARLARESDETLSAFVRGQLSVMIVLGVMYGIGLWAVGIDVGPLIGLIAGLISFVPYLGSIVGVLMGVIAALVQYHDWTHVLLVGAVFVIGQLLEGYVLVPRLVGEKIGLHPVAVIFAVLAGGELFGFLGVLLALPIASVLMVVLRYAHERYRASALVPDRTGNADRGTGGRTSGNCGRGGCCRGRPRCVNDQRTQRRMTGQLPLALRWPAQQRFDSYLPGDNAIAVALLREVAESAHAPWVFVAGAAASGKTHLLIAACAAASEHGRRAQYLPLRSLHGQRRRMRYVLSAAATCWRSTMSMRSPAMTAPSMPCSICTIVAKWKNPLCCFPQRQRRHKSALPCRIWYRACRAARRRRSSRCPTTSAAKCCAQRAQTRGLVLDDSVLDWLFARAQRDLGSLTALLDRLDRESLAAQRRITVPFLRQLLESQKENG